MQNGIGVVGVRGGAVIDVGRLHPDRPDNNTDTLSLGAAPPQQALGPLLLRWVLTRIRFYLWELPFVSFKFLVIYALIFALPLFPLLLLHDGSISQLVADGFTISQLSVSWLGFGWLGSYVLLLAATIYLLNYIDVFWGLHYQWGTLVVPTWVKYSPRKSTAERLVYVPANGFHPGALTLLYGYTQDHFYVRSQGDHLVTVADLSIIISVKVDLDAHRGWYGNFGTPPVRLELDPTGAQKTILLIHGVYFEAQGNGEERARAFVLGLIQARDKKCGLVAQAPPSIH